LKGFFNGKRVFFKDYLQKSEKILFSLESIKLYKTYFQNIKPLLEDIIQRFKEVSEGLAIFSGL
jgi:hypothetical protein